MSVDKIIDYALNGARLSAKEALTLYESASLNELAWAAEQICNAKHIEPIKTYVVDRNINYTNECVSACKFCAFFKSPEANCSYVLSVNEILDKIDEAIKLGATQILMQGGLHPELKIEYFENLFKKIKTEFDITLHSLSAPEIVHISKISDISIKETIRRLKSAGLDSIPGGGAEILVDEIRNKVSPKKCTASEWSQVMHAAANLGLKATATMLIGIGETISDRILHLDKIRTIQSNTNVFTAFIPWTFQPGNTELGGKKLGSYEYLRMLALSRIYLDNVENIQASWVTQGKNIAQFALRCGANDIGSTMIEENVVAAAGVSFKMNESDLVEIIHSAGFDAAKRDTQYSIIKSYPDEK